MFRPSAVTVIVGTHFLVTNARKKAKAIKPSVIGSTVPESTTCLGGKGEGSISHPRSPKIERKIAQSSAERIIVVDQHTLVQVLKITSKYYPCRDLVRVRKRTGTYSLTSSFSPGQIKLPAGWEEAYADTPEGRKPYYIDHVSLFPAAQLQ